VRSNDPEPIGRAGGAGSSSRPAPARSVALRVAPKGRRPRPAAFFAPTRDEAVSVMLAQAELGPDDVLYDLGSGDGRIVVGAAKRYGARGVGVEIDPALIAESWRRAGRARVRQRVGFLERDLFEIDLREATVVSFYLLPDMNVKLRPKLLSELRPGARIVSHDFHMGEWRPDVVVELARSFVYKWVVPARVEGVWAVRILGAARARTASLRLHQEYQVVRGALRLDGRELPLSQVELRGAELRFALARAGGRPPLVFHGRVEGDLLAGSVAPWGRCVETRSFEARRRRGSVPRSG
jgi:Histone methylation protein DOT1